MVICRIQEASGVGVGDAVPPHPAGGGLALGRSQRRHVPRFVEQDSCGLASAPYEPDARTSRRSALDNELVAKR